MTTCKRKKKKESKVRAIANNLVGRCIHVELRFFLMVMMIIIIVIFVSIVIIIVIRMTMMMLMMQSAVQQSYNTH